MKQKLSQCAQFVGIYLQRKTVSIAKCFPSLSDDVIKNKTKEKEIDGYILVCTDNNSLLFILGYFFLDRMRVKMEAWYKKTRLKLIVLV